MSIEITGPERYEFQYHVTLELVLRFWAHDVRAFVDSGGEDSTLDVVIDGSRVELELQVKGAEHNKKAVDCAVLHEYLAHFPSRSSTDSLFERLLKHPSKLVLLVCTQRAMDFASPLTVRPNWCGNTHRKPPLSADAAKSFLAQVVASTPLKDTTLERKRAAALSALGKATSAPELNAAFMRLFLQDNVTKESVIARLLDHLRNLGVPNDKAEAALLQMLQRVRDSKGSGKDVVPALNDVLNAEIAPSVRPSDYALRGIESAWVTELSTQRALLLSGPPRCGKTDAATWVAGAMQEFGFEVLRTGLVDEAERVLLDRRRAEVLVVLDDPLGSEFEESSRAGHALRSLDRLIRELGQNRRLIVAQSQEVLLAARATDSLDEIKTGGLPWHDLGKCHPEFLTKVWEVQSLRNQVTDTVRIAVESAIAAGEIDVPVGVLAHLAAYHQQLQCADVVRQAQSLASESAIDFAMTLRSSGMQKVMRALAIGSTAIETSADRELAFILGEGVELKMPARHDFLNLSPNGPLHAPTAPPTYADAPSLPESARQRLTNLELHRVLRRKQADHFEFSHPYYRSAARALVRQAVSMEKDELLSAIRRGLFAPSPSTSGATARNLWWLHRDLEASLDLGEDLVEMAEKGLRWHFPITRDLCYEFLLEVVQAKPEKYLEKLEHWVISMSRINLEDVIWGCGEPFFPIENEHTNLSFFRKPPSPNEDRVHQTVTNLQSGDALPNPGSAVEALRYFKGNPSELELGVILRLLSYSEGLIRAEAAHVWLLVERTNDDEVMKRLRRDSHPSVVSRILDAVTNTWSDCGSARRVKLVELLRASSSQPETAAIVVTRLLRHFDADDGWSLSSDIPEKPWELVGEVLAPALREFPNTFRMVGHRLYNACNTALTYLSSSSSEAVVNAWIDWLQIKIAAGYLPDDYMLGLVTSLLDAPELSAESRRASIERLLSVPSTGAVLVFVANLVSRWEELRGDERDLVTQLLTSERNDDVWMKAAALTQDCVPAEIQKLLLDSSDGFHVPAAQLIDNLPLPVLTACVRVHRGSPQPLWYLGHHHDNSPTWKGVILKLACMPSHPLFEDCLEELFIFERRYGVAELSQVILELDASGRERAFNLLLDWKTNVVGEWHQREFDLLLELAPNDDIRAEMVGRMVEKSERIIEEVDEIYEWSHRSDVRSALEKAFQNDLAPYQIWNMLTNIDVPATPLLKTGISELLVSAVEAFPPRLPSTHWDVDRYLKALNVGGDFFERAKSVREAAIKDFKEMRFAEANSPAVRLPDWIGPR